MGRLFQKATLFAVAPFAVWMALMFLLPSSNALGYAFRTLASAVALLAALVYFVRKSPLDMSAARCDVKSRLAGVFWGVAAGVVVAVFWVAPEYIPLYRQWCIAGEVPSPLEAQNSAYDPNVCGWALTVLRIVGSAFIIAPAEELFFRSYLYRRLQSEQWRKVDRRNFDLSAFLWTTGLFALEHNRIVAALMAGAFYLFIYRRFGFMSAAVAHVVTNLLLALFVLYTGAWAFW
jgi:CAAX prenyl protease-like protein